MKRANRLSGSVGFLNELIEIEIDGRPYEVRTEVSEVSNDGIGPYEFWGAKCFDRGTDYVSGFKVTEIRIIHPDGDTTEVFEDEFAALENKVYASDEISQTILDHLTEAAEGFANDERWDRADREYEERRDMELEDRGEEPGEPDANPN